MNTLQMHCSRTARNQLFFIIAYVFSVLLSSDTLNAQTAFRQAARQADQATAEIGTRSRWIETNNGLL
jgi:hypothetical protein